MYGAQALTCGDSCHFVFENDVEMYGAQARFFIVPQNIVFENDVEMYGAQAYCKCNCFCNRLRMM